MSADKSASYTIEEITLEYEVVNSEALANAVRINYAETAIVYDRILQHRMTIVDKGDSVWNFNFNSPAKLVKGILILFENESEYGRDSERFYNPDINKVTVTAEGHPNQLFSSGLMQHHQWEEVKKHFAGGRLQEYGNVTKEQMIGEMKHEDYYEDKFALWLDFRTTEDIKLHGSGRRVGKTSAGINLRIKKTVEAKGSLNAHMFLFTDAQVNIKGSTFANVLY